MIADLVITIIVVAAIYFVVKKTVYRCPECSSLRIIKRYGINNKEPVFTCQKCGTVFDKNKRIIPNGKEK